MALVRTLPNLRFATRGIKAHHIFLYIRPWLGTVWSDHLSDIFLRLFGFTLPQLNLGYNQRRVLKWLKGRMALVSGGRSTLNPNAPLFIPAAVRQVEDFSPEWWELITTAAWFRDYWLNQHPGEDFFGNDDDGYSSDVVDLLPDTIDLDMEAQLEEFIQSSGIGETNVSSISVLKGAPEIGSVDALMRSLSLSKSSKERSPKSMEAAKYWEKPAKHVSPKCSPRSIQQPR
ncbi:protein EARLY RESPONSIVE TO DEHYDRATION 15 [Diospyros lotus]|uniref:protein EARLY RESPONSIVE TO DEHYDRATION 15 n=1 Tax=Diospyros lotus TaxID=55363 RepID=UPI0022562C68|nr:protein EARLY RESPONSIVE TO DEHYDRATION 15 [Diospyros lotus]